MAKFLNSLKKNAILLVIITILVLYFVLKDDFNGIVETIHNMKLIYVLIALGFYLVSVTIKGFVNYLIINTPEKVSKKEAICENFISQFFNGVTPFATGGEPMAVYMLTQQGIPLSKATNYMVQSFISYQVALVTFGVIAVGYNFIFKIFPQVHFLQKLVMLGFFINIFVVILLMLSYSKKATQKLCDITIWIRKKLNKDPKEDEINKKFEEYHKGLQEMKERNGLFVMGVGLNMVSLFCLYIVPYYVLKGMGAAQDLSIMNALVSSAYVYLIGGFVPIPGASGGIEYGYTQFYGNFIHGSSISASVLVWRALTYYFGVIVGAILFNVRERVKK